MEWDIPNCKENCSTAYEDAAPQNDLMERLLRAREERK